MIVTVAEAMEASKLSQEQRVKLARIYLAIDLSKAEPEEREWCERVLQLSRTDPDKFDLALAHPKVNELFARGAIYLRRDLK